MAIVAHPDDESFGCGGTLARFAYARADVYVVTFTDGVSSRQELCGAELEHAALERMEHFDLAAKILGIKEAHHYDLLDQAVDTVSSLSHARVVTESVERFRPDVVLTHWPDDLNRDHQLVAQAVLVATRPSAADYVRAVYAFETPSSTEWAFGWPAFSPDTYVELSERVMESKLAAVAQYVDEMRAEPHPRSDRKIRALAEMRGAAIGVRYAEALVTLRRLVPMEGML